MGGVNKWLSKQQDRLGIGANESKFTDVYEKWKKIVPESISENEGEIPVRQYNMAVLRTRWKFMRAEGRLQVTNKRLIFRAAGRSLMGRTTLQHEFNLAEIGGVEVRKDWRFSIFDFSIAFYFSALVGFIFNWIVSLAYADAVAFGIILGSIFGLTGLIPFFTLKKKFLIKALACAASVGSLYSVYNMAK